MGTITMTLSSPGVELKDGKGSLAASVTNAGAEKEPVVLGAFPVQAGSPPGPTYASIDKPLRVIPAGATEQYVVNFDTAGAPAGSHQVKLIAYSADEAPEDYADQAHVVTLAVPAAAEKPKRKFPWLWVVIGAVVLVALIGGVVWFLMKDVNVPPVEGKQVAEATQILKDAGFSVETTEKEDAAPEGQVLSQEPDDGTSAPRGSNVTLEVAVPVKVTMPDILGNSIETAREALTAANLELVFTSDSACTSSPPPPPNAIFYDFCAVAGVEPKPGEPAEVGERVAVVAELRKNGGFYQPVNKCLLTDSCAKIFDLNPFD
ncbi:PASTA domain-containing protein [Pseudarthrobacter sp. J64]|uniref:PASTA domain-containing protein n=1 Tax=Pseudarthrobacter sp. J64 TaxID=3116485 RepID=UPI002E802B1F|nr:PASTA domain-containing protein [Pseudarthrobacter sp. J64]MEE2568877.1 PASTA domain-containing protein [Pseudarthrobacter sp. J64]